MELIKCVLWLSLLALVMTLELTMHTDCGSHAKIHSISLDPCNKEPCTIQRGQTYTTHINFTAREHTNTATNVCHGLIGGIPENFPVSPENACGNGVICPIMPGETQVYSASVTCPTDAPELRMVGKWQLQDDRGHDIICFAFPLVIQ